MKTTINKSQVMKRAWNIYRGHGPYSYSFSDALRRAWHIEKANIAYETKQLQVAIEKAEREAWYAERTNRAPVALDMSRCAIEYAAGTNGRRYFGD